MTPDQTRIVEQLRAQGYALSIFSPEELRGVDSKRVEDRVSEVANETIGFLTKWIDPDSGGECCEVELTYTPTGLLTECLELYAEKPVDVMQINRKDLLGAYVHEMTVPQGFQSMQFLQQMGMGYGSDLNITEVQDDTCVKMSVVASPYVLRAAFGVSAAWTHIGAAGNQQVWIRRDPAADALRGRNLFQCTPDDLPPPDASGGYPNLSALLALKGEADKFKPGAACPPLDSNWLCASEHTRDSSPDTLYECVFGNTNEGLVIYQMSIERDGSQFTPFHGSVKMAPVASAMEAAQCLHAYWNNLPDSSRMTWQAYEAKLAAEPVDPALKARLLEFAFGNKGIKPIESDGMLTAVQNKTGRPIFVTKGDFGKARYKQAHAEAKAAGIEFDKMYVYADTASYSGDSISFMRLDESLPHETPPTYERHGG